MVDLSAQNYWWTESDWTTVDPDYVKWLESSPRWEPRLLNQIDAASPSLNFLFGPRQTGKTTLMKLFIKRLLDKGVRPEAIFYYRCDELADFKELDQVLREYLRFRNAKAIESSIIILDEVTYPSQWWRAIKYLIDTGELRKDAIILTGSLSMFAKGEIETFPGRRGSGKDFVMHPLSFRDFVKVASGISQTDVSVDLDGESLYRLSSSIPPGELSRSFENYLISGGYPLSVKSILNKGYVSRDAVDSLLSGIKGDLAKLNANESIAKRVVKGVISKVPSAISLSSLAREFELGSHRTVFKYLDLLEKLFIVNILYFIDPFTGSSSFLKNRKVHLTDPLLYRIFSEWCLAETPDEAAIVESVVASHLARQFETGYWSNGREVDIVVLNNKIMVGFEVKYQNNPLPVHISAGKMREVITLSKSTFKEKPVMIPASNFLQLLDV